MATHKMTCYYCNRPLSIDEAVLFLSTDPECDANTEEIAHDGCIPEGAHRVRVRTEEEEMAADAGFWHDHDVDEIVRSTQRTTCRDQSRTKPRGW